MHHLHLVLSHLVKYIPHGRKCMWERKPIAINIPDAASATVLKYPRPRCINYSPIISLCSGGLGCHEHRLHSLIDLVRCRDTGPALKYPAVNCPKRLVFAFRSCGEKHRIKQISARLNSHLQSSIRSGVLYGSSFSAGDFAWNGIFTKRPSQ